MLPSAMVGGGLVLYARAVDGEVVGEFALVGNLEGVCPSGEGLDGNVILDSDSVTVIDVPGAAAAVAAEVDGTGGCGIATPATATGQGYSGGDENHPALRLHCCSETKQLCIQTSRPGKTVHGPAVERASCHYQAAEAR